MLGKLFVGLFISQMSRSHPLPLILPQMLLKTHLREENEGDVRLSEHMVQAVSKNVRASETTRVVHVSDTLKETLSNAKRQLLLREVAMTSRKT